MTQHARIPLLAVGALVAGFGYLTWRLLFTMGAPPLIAVPLVAAEAVWLARFALSLAATGPEPGPGVQPADADAQVAPVELLVPAAGATLEMVERTLAVAFADGPSRVRVLDDRQRDAVEHGALRLGASYEVFDASGAAGLVDAAVATASTDVVAWLDAGWIPVPGFLRLEAAFSEQSVAVVQSAVDLVNTDSLLHLSPSRDELSLENRVAGPSLDRAGAAPWRGSGSLIRVAALEEIGGFPQGPAAASHRAALRLARAGWSVRHCSEPLVRAEAPDTLADYLVQAGRTAHGHWRILFCSDTPLRPGAGLRRSLSQIHASTAALDGLARLVAFAVLLATLVGGRLPFSAAPVVVLAAFLVQFGLRVLASERLGRGATGVGDQTREGLRLMGAHVRALFVAPRARSGRQRTRWAVLGHLPLLTGVLLLVDVALVARALTYIWPELLPPLTDGGRVVAMAAAVWAIVAIVDVLHVLVRRVQRRGHHRNAAVLLATVDGQGCRTVDVTPHGLGLLVATRMETGRIVPVELNIPRLDGSYSVIRAQGRIEHSSTRSVDGRFRSGLELIELAPEGRDALVEFCALSAEHRDRGRDRADHLSPEDLEVGGPGGGRRALAILSVTSLALAGPFVMFGPSASAAPGGNSVIDGIVHLPDGSPAVDACVSLWNSPDWAWARTDEDGRFSLTGLSGGSYTVYADDCGAGKFFTTFAPSTPWASEADLVDVAPEGSVSGVEITLRYSGVVSGVVVDDTGAPVPDVCINQVRPDGSWESWWLGYTDSEGRFSGRVPAEEDVLVQYNDCSWPQRFPSGWLPGTTDQSAATAVQAGPGSETDVGKVVVERGAEVSGRVTDQGGKPVANACVSAQVVEEGGWQWAGGSSTDAEGNYRFMVPPGTYSLWASDCDGEPDLMSAWYPDAPGYTYPPPTVDVQRDRGQTFDFSLRTGVRASGTVTDSQGQAASGVCVSLHPVDSLRSGDWWSVGWARADDQGNWVSDPVAEGEYYVQFSNCDGNGSWTEWGQWIPEFHEGVWTRGPWDLEDLRSVAVKASEPPHLTTRLTRTGWIKGQVTVAEDGTPAPEVCISGTGGNEVRTDGDGRFSVPITPGRHTLFYSDCQPGRGLQQERLDIDIAEGAGEYGDMAMKQGQPARVVGRVTNARGAAIQPACVVAYLPDELLGYSLVAADGTYAIEGLGAGQYWIGVYSCQEDPSIAMTDPDTGEGYPATWYPDYTILFSGRGGPDPEAEGVPPVTLRSSEVTQADFCFGGCSTTTVPDPTATVPDPTTTVPDPTTTVPDPTTTVPDPTTTVPDPTTTVPDPTTTVPDPTTTVPGSTTTPPTTAPTTTAPPATAPPATAPPATVPTTTVAPTTTAAAAPPPQAQPDPDQVAPPEVGSSWEVPSESSQSGSPALTGRPAVQGALVVPVAPTAEGESTAEVVVQGDPTASETPDGEPPVEYGDDLVVEPVPAGDEVSAVSGSGSGTASGWTTLGGLLVILMAGVGVGLVVRRTSGGG